MALRMLSARSSQALRPVVVVAPTRRYVHVEARITEKGLRLPAVTPAKGNYVSAVRTGNLMFLSGHLPYDEAGTLITGKVGKDLTVEQAYVAAARIGLGLLATIKHELGDLDRIKRVVQVTGLVNSPAEFSQHPAVINGVSDLLVSVLGEAGKHTRVAAGYSNLPLNCAVEASMIVEVDDSQ